MSNTIGQRIRERRESAKIGLREFAAMIQVSPSYYSKVERDLEKPSAELLEKIGPALKFTTLETDAMVLDAGAVSSDVVAILKGRPDLCDLVRRAAYQRVAMDASKPSLIIPNPRA